MIEVEVKEIQEIPEMIFEVIVFEGDRTTEHCVTLPEVYYQMLTDGDICPMECVRAAFRFLLEREPKECILSTFELPIIGEYFPSFPRKFKNYVR
jgi:hypothetical protein